MVEAMAKAERERRDPASSENSYPKSVSPIWRSAELMTVRVLSPSGCTSLAFPINPSGHWDKYPSSWAWDIGKTVVRTFQLTNSVHGGVVRDPS